MTSDLNWLSLDKPFWIRILCLGKSQQGPSSRRWQDLRVLLEFINFGCEKGST